MKYEIINPSDPYEISGDNFTTIAVATLLLGRGAYGLKNESDEMVLPVFLLGGADEWITKNVGDLGEYIDAHKPELAAALDTVVIPGGRERSSLNNIGSYAKALAKKLRTPHPDETTRGRR